MWLVDNFRVNPVSQQVLLLVVALFFDAFTIIRQGMTQHDRWRTVKTINQQSAFIVD